MLAAIHHRGPDANGVQPLTGPGDRAAALGAVRLRIIDLDPKADQPMSNADGDVWTVFNGEIYNFKELRAELEAAGFAFKSASDTECLVHLYRYCDGDIARIASRLRGMFAFAIWDNTAGRLVMARDRLGIKPLYWARTADGLAFCSEQRALAKSGLVSTAPNIAALAGYLAKGVLANNNSVFEHIERLPPGHAITWTGGAPSITEWWRPVCSMRADFSFEERAQTELTSAVTDAVARHLVSDRTLGVFLSSGTDSSAVAALAAQAGAHKTLTVGFPDHASLDEGGVARATAQRLGLDHSEVPVTAADARDALPDVLASFDSPTTDGLNTWLISRAAKQAGLVVVLSGLGGDELLAGYPTFQSVPRLRRGLQLINVAPRSLRRAVANVTKQNARTRPWSRALEGGSGVSGAYHLVRRVFDDSEIASIGFAPPTLFEVPAALNDVDAVTTLELGSYLRDQLLPDSDTTSMAHSIELRVPLLDDRVVATSLAFPSAIRLDGKQMLATAAGLGPRPPKRPFALPMAYWMQSTLQDTVRDALLDNTLAFADVLPEHFRKQVWADFEQGRVHWAKPWSIAMLRLWPQANGFSW